jgi:hypothetical protein
MVVGGGGDVVWMMFCSKCFFCGHACRARAGAASGVGEEGGKRGEDEAETIPPEKKKYFLRPERIVPI